MARFGMHSKPMGFAISLGNRDGLRKLYEYMSRNNLHVEAQTFTKDPFIYYKTEEVGVKERRDKYDLYDELMNMKLIASHYQQDIDKIYVIASADSASALNVIGDSCWKGAELMKEFIRCFDLLSGYSNQISFDIMEKDREAKRLLFGGSGAMSVDGIKKPVYHCQGMFIRAGDYIVGKNDSVIIFNNNDGNYSVLCHNAKPLGHWYYLNEGHLKAMNINQCFDDLDQLAIHVRINNIADGKYIIKTRDVSAEGGSVQENYVKMTQDEDVYIHPNDIEFLRQVSIPMISVYETTVKNGLLELDITLSANAFSLINIVKQY